MTVASAIALIFAVGLAATIWRRRGQRLGVALVESLRVLIIGFAIWLLHQPETVYRLKDEAKRSVILLHDESSSMNTVDVAGKARSQTADRLVRSPSWKSLDRRFQLVTQGFGDASASDLAGAIEAAANGKQRPAAIVLLSDGDWNRGAAPIETVATIAAASRDAPKVFAITLGSDQRLPDVELVSADVPSYGVVGKSVRVPYTVRNWVPRSVELTAKLWVGDTEYQSQKIKLRSGHRFDGVMAFEVETAGDYRVAVEVSTLEEERVRENNRQAKSIEVREERLRVLVIETLPRWEYRYLCNALRRDPGIELSCLLFHPQLGRRGGGAEYITEFPADAAALASYDVVFLGDVGASAGQLNADDCRRITGLVMQQASGLILMPGPRGHQGTLLSSDLKPLYPVELDLTRADGVGTSEPSQLSLTETGRQSLLTELNDDPETNWRIWESLPGFHWHTAVARARVGSSVLGVHSDSSNRYGRVPLLVTRSAGAGKVLFMGTDAVWRWRLGVEDKYHYRFWGQVIRWMAYQRNMAVGNSLRLSFRPERPDPGDTVSFRATVMNQDGSPSQSKSVPLSLASPSGAERRIRLSAAGSEWGVFVGEARLSESGVHQIEVTHPTNPSKVEARIAVQGRAVELVGAPARSNVMRSIARVGGGESYAPAMLDALIERLNSLPPREAEIRRIQWWNHFGVIAMLLMALSVFWVGRKWIGEV